MVSKKMEELTKGSSIIRAMFEDGKKMANMYGVENVYDFSLGNPFTPPPLSVNRAIIDIVNNTPQTTLHGYTNNSGYEDVRDTIAESINSKNNTSYNRENIVMTTGAAAGLNIIFKCILNPSDEVIVFAPFFGEYKNYAALNDADIVSVLPDFSSFMPDIDKFRLAITEKTKAVIINSPNNPTGVIYDSSTISKISEILKDAEIKYNHPIYIISDEPYRELIYRDTKVPFIPDFYDNTFIAYSYSKSLSLPGERIGYVVINNKLSDFSNMTFALNVANRIMGFVNAPSLMQRVIKECINEKTDVSLYKENRDNLYNMLVELGYEVIKPEGAFYMFPKSPILDDVKFCNIAKEYRLILVPGSAFGTPGYLRLAYCVSPETIKNSYESFKKLKERIEVEYE